MHGLAAHGNQAEDVRCCRHDCQATGRAPVRRVFGRQSQIGHVGCYGRGGDRGENVPGCLACEAGCWRDLPPQRQTKKPKPLRALEISPNSVTFLKFSLKILQTNPTDNQSAQVSRSRFTLNFII